MQRERGWSFGNKKPPHITQINAILIIHILKSLSPVMAFGMGPLEANCVRRVEFSGMALVH